MPARTDSVVVPPPVPPRPPVVVPDPEPVADGAPRRTRRRVPAFRLGPYALLVPAAVVVLLGLGYPLVRQFVLSFQEYGLAQQFGRPAEWVGLDNYVTLLSDPYVWGVIARSVAFCLVNAAVTMAVGVALAVLMTKVSRGPRITLQVGLLLAWGTPVLATMTVWQWLFDSQYGVVNWLLAEPLGFSGMSQHSWLIEPLSFYFVATVIVVWMSVPFVVFSVYAGLLQVPAECVEAAQLDGATGWQRFRFLAVPLIKPVLFVVGLLQVIWDLRVFTQIYVLQRAGAPTRETHLLGTYIYSLSKEFSMAGAMATIMLLITLVLTGSYIRRTLREEEL
ncbi:carbohydrate ABC transporter permease [Modestobacter versicolor]|uniref:N,N'-diacetylchitobiose transport system permease protein n=1 Tax=Modestobacter versicolor TaxID=429133 RepID=A0A323VC68_9ACTN|nr:sugar ABC transporter permease [Modestobacter versicolor]MBB3675900.1 N,N'-diacetylchitobiose transport system permease protein [Modestobacter versicolor]PZA20806.1 sugar ABC transporter permease [Modestobacter versicolor]